MKTPHPYSNQSVRLTASITVDLDPIGHYLKARGWQSGVHTNLDAVYTAAVPRFLRIFEQYNICATFFAVGRDADNRNYRGIFKDIVSAGHEVANHTTNHDSSFLDYPDDKKVNEIVEAEKAIEKATGTRPVGFRAPGWNIDGSIFEILEKRGYKYDSSILPSYFTPVLRVAHLLTNNLKPAQCFGRPYSLAYAPRRPYHLDIERPWLYGEAQLIEFPIATTRYLRMPILGAIMNRFGPDLLRRWIRRASDIPIVLCLHGLDLIDYDREIRDSRLLVKPGLGKPIEVKERNIREIIEVLRERQLMTLADLSENS